MWRCLLTFVLPLLLCGCSIIPEIAHEPRVHNPFPQLSRVAVLPFFNLSSEETVDGREFALAYFNELQLVPGFEVVPVGVAEKKMLELGLKMDTSADARTLAQSLGVDAVVIGAVTDFSSYYPPRCSLHVQWFAANPCYHPIPPGYGLPWGTTEEEHIPDALVFEAEMALAKAQLRTQTPTTPPRESGYLPTDSPPPGPEPEIPEPGNPVIQTGAFAELDRSPSVGGVPIARTGLPGTGLPSDWPNPKGFIPPAPSPTRPRCFPSERSVMEHTRAYNGHDAEFTTALRTYVGFRDDARFGGIYGYLQRTDDFIRFCCYKHIAEMLTARGGASKTRVVWRWSADR